jgi:hypothetical protein
MRFRHTEDAERVGEMQEAWDHHDKRQRTAKERRRSRIRAGRWHRRSHDEAELRRLASAAANLLRTHRLAGVS